MAERLIGGRYRVTGTLGHGGMASVYRAVDEQLGREVAVKLFRIGPVDHGERARAESEIQVLAALRSPSLVTLYDAALDDPDGESYLVMELVPGSDLATRLREGALDPVSAARLGAQVADGLAAAHAQAVVHRDVKPANVLLELDGVHVKLADFGIALLRDSARVTGTGTVIGTAAYIAPEQVLGQEITGKADVYALGLTLLETLTGRQPFPGSAVESATARLARGPEIDQHLPTAWRTLLHVMTATDPAERPTAAEAADRLRALSRDDVEPATQLLPGGPGTVTPLAAAGGAAGLAAAAAGASGADAATQAMPMPTGATGSGADAATRVLTTSGTGQDGVPTTVLGASGAGQGGSGGGSAAPGRGPVPPAAAGAPGTIAEAEPKRGRRGLVITLVVLGVLVLAGIVVAVLALGNGGGTPAPTDSTSPSQQQSPSEEPSQQQSPSEEPSEQPSEPSEEPSEPSQEPTQQEPTQGPQPSVEPTLPVQTPVADTTTTKHGPADAGPGGGPAGTGGPGNSENAPGHNKH